MTKYRFDQIALNCTDKIKASDIDITTYIGLEHLDSGNLTVNRWGSDVPIKGEKLSMKKGDVLLGKRNAYLRRAAIAPHNGAFSAHGMVLRPNENVVDKDFFPLFIGSDYFFDTAIRISVGSVSPTINWKDLKVQEFELPDLETQRELSKVLWAINYTMQSYKRLISATDELVKSQFIEMFGLNKSKTLEIPTYTLNSVCTKITDGSHNPPKGINDSDYYMLSSKNIVDDTITLDNPRFLTEDEWGIENKRTQISSGDVLLTIVGTVGRCAVVPKGHANIALQRSVCVLKPKKDMINSYFLFYQLKCMQSCIEGFAQGAAQKGIYLTQVGKLEVVVPDLIQQEAFVEFLQQSNKSKFELEQALVELNAVYKRLIAENLG